MKKFLMKLFFACIPLILYSLIFVIYEPYNYWGLKGEKSGNWATPLARVREFMRNPEENIILGDSRMNHFDLDGIEEQTGIRYANLSTGGQGANLSKQMYEWAKGRTVINNLIIDVSFYQIRNGNFSPSAEPVYAIAESPMAYIVTRDYVTETFELFYKDIKNRMGHQDVVITEKSVVGDTRYRSDLVEYATENILPGCQGYSIGQEQMDSFIYIVDDTRKNGGTSIIVIPPVQESIWDYVIYPLELENQMTEYKEVLASHATIYDGEWISEFAKNQNIYADGFHFLNADGYEQFSNAIFERNENIFRIRDWEEQRK